MFRRKNEADVVSTKVTVDNSALKQSFLNGVVYELGVAATSLVVGLATRKWAEHKIKECEKDESFDDEEDA